MLVAGSVHYPWWLQLAGRGTRIPNDDEKNHPSYPFIFGHLGVSKNRGFTKMDGL